MLQQRERDLVARLQPLGAITERHGVQGVRGPARERRLLRRRADEALSLIHIFKTLVADAASALGA